MSEHPLLEEREAERAARNLALQLDDRDHPDVETTLTAYVDGQLDEQARASVDEHLATCSRCREDVADLRATQQAIRPRSHAWRWLAVAAVFGLAITTAVLLARKKPVPPMPINVQTAQTTTTNVAAPPKDDHPEWRARVEKALGAGALKMPASLAALQIAPDQLRAPEGETAHLEPVGAIVDATRPRFTWTPTPDATYVVSIFDGDTPVAESGTLHAAEWRPDRDLPRGRIYQWQVEVRAGDDVTILPTPPAPPALFRVLDAHAHAELEQARAAHANDHLLLGVLYASHGLRAEAETELRKVESPDGRKLLHSVEAWRR